MPGLPTSGFAVWQKASVSAVDFGDDGETFSQVRLVLMCNAGFSPLQAIMIWVPYTKTNGQWIASKILQGFFGAPIESLCEISVTDLVSTELYLLGHASIIDWMTYCSTSHTREAATLLCMALRC